MDIFRLITVFLFVGTVQAVPPVYSIELEESLRTELFTGYTLEQRPSQTVRVKVSFTILTINELNIKDQTLSLSGYLTMDWSDSRLSWENTSTTAQDYSSVNFLFSSEKYVWRPAIIIENAVDGISVISDEAIPMRIAQNGRVIWNPAGVYKVSCESDTKYYPMDTQTCYLKVSAWAYTSGELSLDFKLGDAVDRSFYTENGEWDLLSALGSKSTAEARDTWSFSSLTFSIKLQRRLLFHVVNTLFPVALMAILIAFVFKLPVDSGEKIGFSLTVLLAYAVYLSLISDNIPSTSVTVCYLSLYLAYVLLMAAIAVCCSTFVISLHMRTDDDKMPEWVKKFTFKYLMRVACWNNSYSCCTRNKNKVKDGDSELFHHKSNDILLMDKLKHDHDEASHKEESPKQLTWKELSEIMDKVFYNVYMTLIILSTFILFVIIIAGYYSAA